MSLRISISHFMMVWNVESATPSISRPVKLGWKRTSGQRKRSFPITMMLPSGSSKDFSRAEDSAAFFISSSKSTATKHMDSLMSRTISRSAVGEGVTFVDGHGVADTVTAIKHTSRGTTGGVQTENGLDVDVHGGHVEGLEHDLRHALTVGLGILRGFGQ